MISLMHSQIRSEKKEGSKNLENSSSLSSLANIDFIYLYAGWEENQSGRCYLLNQKQKIGREVRTDNSDDIEQILKARNRGKEASNQVILLLFSFDGWYSGWNEKKLNEVERAWKLKVIPVYNVRFPQ